MQKTVAVNELGLRIGEDHPNAKLADAEVELIRSLHVSVAGGRGLQLRPRRRPRRR